MKTPEQLKGAIRNIAVSKNLRSQEVLQMFLFERILERLSVSPYRSNFILKGGLLISSMLGISELTTMDMDTTGLLYTSRKAAYQGVARLGIEALVLKIRGYSITDIAGLYGVPPSHVGAWISRSAQKLRGDPTFMAALC